MTKDYVKAIYYCCFFAACFGCLGTFASFLFARSNKSLNKTTNDYFKVSCPILVVLSFVVMGVVRCLSRKSTTSRRQQIGPDEGNQSVSRNTTMYFSDNIFLRNLPSYDEAIRISQPSELPPKYEDIARQSWKPEDHVIPEHRGLQRSTTIAETSLITSPRSDTELERGLASVSGSSLELERGLCSGMNQIAERDGCLERNQTSDGCIISDCGNVVQGPTA